MLLLLAHMIVAARSQLQVISPLTLAAEFEPYSIIQSKLSNLGILTRETTQNKQVIVPASNVDGCKDFVSSDFS